MRRETDQPFDPVELAMLQGTGYFGVSQASLEEIAEELFARGDGDISAAAWACGIDPANLKKKDVRAIKNYLTDIEEEDEDQDVNW